MPVSDTNNEAASVNIQTYLGPSCVGERLPGMGGRGWLLLPGVALNRPTRKVRNRKGTGITEESTQYM